MISRIRHNAAGFTSFRLTRIGNAAAESIYTLLFENLQSTVILSQASFERKKNLALVSSERSTLQKKDEDAASERVIHKGSLLFKTEDIKRKSGYEEKYDDLLLENKLLFTLDLVKEKLSAAYAMTDETKMADSIIGIIDICKGKYSIMSTV